MLYSKQSVKPNFRLHDENQRITNQIETISFFKSYVCFNETCMILGGATRHPTRKEPP